MKNKEIMNMCLNQKNLVEKTVLIARSHGVKIRNKFNNYISIEEDLRSSLVPFLTKYFLSLFIHFETDRDSTNRGGAERQRILSRLHAASTDSDMGLELTNHEIMI